MDLQKLNGFKLATNIANELYHQTRPGSQRATRAPAGKLTFDLPIQVPREALLSVGLALGLVPPNVESILHYTCVIALCETKTKSDLNRGSHVFICGKTPVYYVLLSGNSAARTR